MNNSNPLKVLLSVLGIDGATVKDETTPEQVKQGILSVSVSLTEISPETKEALKKKLSSDIMQMLWNENEIIGISIAEERPDGMYVAIADYLKACSNLYDNSAGKKLRTVAATYGMLNHEAIMYMFINDAGYDWDFLNGLLMDMPETHSPIPTYDRFKESMKWISRTIDTIDDNVQSHNPKGPMNVKYGSYIKNLKNVLLLVCAEEAKKYGFYLDFDYEAAESLKTMPLAKLQIPPYYGKVRNPQVKA